MKTGIIGLPQAGKRTIFEALTRNFQGAAHQDEARVGTVKVADQRVDVLSKMYHPKKTTYLQMEYFLPSPVIHKRDAPQDTLLFNQVRDCEALIHVVRNFRVPGGDPPQPRADFFKLDQELTFADLMVAEKRLERLTLDGRRGKKIDPEELALIEACHENLNQDIPLRKVTELASAQRLRGFTFLTAKQVLVLFNNPDDVEEIPEVGDLLETETCMALRGKLEQELAQMSPEEAREFLNEFQITAPAAERVIKQTAGLLDLITFFTMNDEELRAWHVPQDTPALEAAGTVHSDMKRGFIRAEVISFDDLMSAGGFPEARKKGLVRLEGKTYPVQDGDIINVRFNV